LFKTRHRIKKLIKIELRKLRFKLLLQGKKLIFQTLDDQQLLELHRSLNKDSFLEERIIFSDNPEKIYKKMDLKNEDVHETTEDRLELMQCMQIEYYKHFHKPFSLGQDDILRLPPLEYVTKLPTLLDILKPYLDPLIPLVDQREPRIASFQNLENKIAHKIPSEHTLDIFKIFRLAFIFKDYKIESLTPFLTDKKFKRFFGFDHRFYKSPDVVISLVNLYQKEKCTRDSEEKKELIRNWLLTFKTCHDDIFPLNELTEILKCFLTV
jgi:hypothetical protein